MPSFLSDLAGEHLALQAAAAVLRAVAILFFGLVLARFLGNVVGRLTSGWAAPERSVFAGRMVSYGVIGLATASALRELGFDLSVLLGAAGVLSVAIGFASQTSASNIISGIFLIAERPFSVGDFVQIASTQGEVVSVDLLSVKLRTPDNLYVRVPNETAMKAEIVNLTRYPIRRLDVMVSVAYKEDLDRVREILVALCDANPRVFDEPRPVVRFSGFLESGVQFKLAAWTSTAGFWDVKDGFALEVKAELQRQGIEIPFPHRTLYTGAASQPLPVRVVGS